ncbi:MAG TPA: AAA family ATPase [Mycobacteriales bacterium]|nr:AAA family ATPase [Mycobacteriales bacterium]
MRDSMKAEITVISEAVARSVFTQSNLFWMVEREIQSRLPGTIQQYAQSMLPELAKTAVADAAPDQAEIEGRVERVAFERLQANVPGLVSGAAENLLPSLARTAVQEATPDLEKLREELAAAVATEVSGIVREQTGEVLADVVKQATDQVRAAVTDSLQRQSEGVIAEMAQKAVAEATPDVKVLHDDLIDRASETVTGIARKAIRAAMPEVVATVSEEALSSVRGTVRDEAAKAFEQYGPNVVKVILPQGGTVELATDTHSVLPELLVALHARCHVLLVGPAGTGKSMLAKHVAQALGLEFQALSMGPTTPMSKVFGYFDAHGNYHDTPFRRAFEHGGVMLLDELDNAHPGLLAELNQALALGTCAFADGMVDAHENFRLVATGNTYGTGGDRQYVGRQTLDSATLDRFVVIDVPIDEGLEERIALRYAPSHPDAVHELLTEVRELREAAETKQLPVIFSPRASIDGAKLLEAGATVEQVLEWRVVRGLSEAHRTALGVD